MASLAFYAASAGVYVLNCVTRVAVPRQVLVTLTRMTCRACDLLMCADQGEPRFRMIERLGTAPAVLTVTSLAFCAEATFVRFYILVAVDALVGCTAEFFSGLVAALAA